MDNELDAFSFGNSDLKNPSVLICADQHQYVAEIEHTDRVPIGMQHVLILDPVLAGTIQSHGILTVKLT
jgi:hypothetical protein